MKQFFQKPCRFGILYGLCLILAVTGVLLDTFVIPTSISKVHSAQSSETSSAESSGAGGATSEGQSSGGTGTYTENSYTDGGTSITLKELDQYNTHVYVVDLVLSDVSQLKTAFADDTYGRNIKQTTSEMAENNDAILAINGDYYGFRNKGYVLRNGVLYRDSSAGNEDLAVLSDGSFQIIEEGDTSANSLLKEGALQVFSFGPALVNNGKITISQSTEVEQAMVSNPRTAIGMISPLHYVIIVSDGRTKESKGLSLYQLASLFIDKGCTVAYNLDGGGSSTLWFHGSVVNQPTDGRTSGEREVSDIVYIGTSSK